MRFKLSGFVVRLDQTLLFCCFMFVGGCQFQSGTGKLIPAVEYAKSVNNSSYPSVKWVDGNLDTNSDSINPSHSRSDPGVRAKSSMDFRESMHGASLWQESHAKAGLFHDFRAWKPMDLITIVVSEISEGRKEADTLVQNQSSISAAISKLLGIESTVQSRNTQLDPTALIDATTQSQYNGQGETIRKGSLKGTISAMVVEVLSSGILRIEGKKIISVNNEEQVMVISGLVRVRDIDSFNRVQSGQIANMRIDYFGNGVVNDVQGPGWFTRLVSKVWPF